jgi:dCMP deaminase
MAMALIVAKRGTCPRRQVGCVLVDFNNHVVATGYNGAAKGSPHCIDTPCPGANYPPGQGYDECQAIHAEQNALLQCKDVYSIKTAYVTTTPCTTCTKLLLNTSCQDVYFFTRHGSWDEAESLWAQSRGPGRFTLFPDDLKIQMDISAT